METQPKVFVAGDTHGSSYDTKKLNNKFWPEQKQLTKEDILIILGDFGFIWDNIQTKEELWWLNWFADKRCTVCFLDGNHENHPKLAELEEVTFNGGCAAVAHKNKNGVVYHLKRGEIYTFGTKKVLVFGGALSVDKYLRIDGISWWKEELPTFAETVILDNNLESINNTVDFILTHTTCKTAIHLLKLLDGSYLNAKYGDPTTEILESVLESTNFKQWHFGHFHRDVSFGNRFFCHYENPPFRII